MKTTRILSAAVICAFALAPAGDSIAKAKPKPKPQAVNALALQTAASAVTAIPILSPAAAASTPPFSNPTTPQCVTLTNQTFANGNATMCGMVSTLVSGVDVFPGIQYGTAQRWAKPTAYQLTSGSLTNFGPVCPQPAKNAPNQSENCLYLNVWVPPGGIKPANTYPVMVFIHGGAFITGAGSLPLYDGSAFAANGVILVTLNYRLGPLGFMNARGEYGVSAGGNYGIMDQQLAMQWVYDNIGAFGGNQKSITLFGESAGAMSVGLHLFSAPGSQTYFQSAIMESNPVGLLYRNQGTTGPNTIGNQYLIDLCSVVTNQTCTATTAFNPQTATISAAQFAAAETAFFADKALQSDATSGYTGINGLPFAPVVDNSLIMGQPVLGYASGMPAKPTVFGTNKDEGAVFAAMVAAAVAAKNPLSHNPAKNPPAIVYNKVVAGSFPPNVIPGQGNTKTADYIAKNVPGRYGTGSGNPTDYTSTNNTYYNRTGQVASNVVLDYDFAIGNIVLANNALSTGGGGASAPMYAYYFDQAPLWDIYGGFNATNQWVEADNGACDPAYGDFTCHGSELAYVFATVNLVAPSNVTVPQANVALGQIMNAAWAAFAKNPTNPGAPWTQAYANSTNGASAVELDCSAASPPNGCTLPTAASTIDPNGVYGTWQPWLTASVVNGIASGTITSQKPRLAATPRRKHPKK